MRLRGLLTTSLAAVLLAGCSLPFSDVEDGKVTPSEDTADAQGGSADKEPQPTSVTVASSGDILIHVPVRDSAKAFAQESGAKAEYDFAPMFAGVKKNLSSPDVTICHQETPISATNKDLSARGSMIYSAPKEIAPAMKSAGIDGCSTASNHTWDREADGVSDTRTQLKKSGLKVAGPTASASEPGHPAMYDAQGVQVASLSYTYTLLNMAEPNTQVPPGQEHMAKFLWPKIGAEGIIADAKKAKEAGAEIVVANIHWGGEYMVEPSDDQTELAKKLLASPYVDGIFGAHAHVIQPCSTINGKTVFYGLGNFLSNQGPGTVGSLDEYNADGAIAKYTFTRDAKGKWSQKASYQPTMVHRLDRHKIKASTPQSDPKSFGRTKERMNQLGNCKASAEGDAK